jgi:cytochrome c oxidase subunit IV
MDDGTATESTLPKRWAGTGRYAATFAALLALATVSFVLSRARIGGLPVALLIAATKAVLVLWFFMHLAAQHASSRIAILVAAMMILLLVGLTSLDVASRHTFPASGAPPPSSGYQQTGAPRP